MRTGTFSHMEGDRFVLQTGKGEWKMFGDKGLQVPPQGSPVRFDARKEPGRDGREYWRLKEIYVDGAQPMTPVGTAAAAQAPLGESPAVREAREALERAQREEQAKAAEEAKRHPPAGYRDRTHPDDQRAMFVTGVVTRAMGSGKFDPSHCSDLTREAIKAWDLYVLGKIVPTGGGQATSQPSAQHGATELAYPDTGPEWEPDEPPIPEDDGR